MTQKLLLTPKEAAAFLGISVDTLHTLAIPFVPLEGRGAGLRNHRRYSRHVLTAWLAGPTPAMTFSESTRVVR